MKRILGIALVLVLGLAPFAAAQTARGNIYGNVTDASGGVLPGATVTISGDFGSNATVTDDLMRHVPPLSCSRSAPGTPAAE